MMNIFRNRGLETALVALGYYEGQTRGSMFRGYGSLVWGHTVTVTNPKEGWVTIVEHEWSYDCDGNMVKDDTDCVTLRIAEALARLVQVKWRY